MFGVVCNLFWATFVNTRYIFFFLDVHSIWFKISLILSGSQPVCWHSSDVLDLRRDAKPREANVSLHQQAGLWKEMKHPRV